MKIIKTYEIPITGEAKTRKPVVGTPDNPITLINVFRILVKQIMQEYLDAHGWTELPGSESPPEDAQYAWQSLGEDIDTGLATVEVEATEGLHQRLGLILQQDKKALYEFTGQKELDKSKMVDKLENK